jgi:hypothetical protein
MNPTAPAATPLTSNTNQPFGGFGQAQSDYGTASNILNYLPTQESQTTSAATNANNNPGSILPNINIQTPTYTAPQAKVINASNFGTNLTGYNTAVQQAEQGLTGAENAEYGSAMNALSGAEQQYGNLTPVYQQLASSYNIPGYQNDIATLSGLLQNLNKDVNAQTTLGGGLMTESARDEMYANEAQPLNTAINNAGQFLQYGQNDVNNLLDTYEKSLTNELNPLQTNISNLPTLFGQTNEAAQAGYEQGATSIQNTIQNQISQEEANAAAQQSAAFTKEVNANYGTGNLANTLAAGSGASGSLGGVSRGANGYSFTSNGKPVTAAAWAADNGQNPATVIAYMAQNGDANAQRANSVITANPNMSITQLATQFPELFGGLPISTPATKKTTSSSGPSNSVLDMFKLVDQPMINLGALGQL